MRKRIRKKRHLGEFREYGFSVSFSFVVETSAGKDDEQLAFIESFIAEAIEANGLCCGGGGGKEWEVFITRDGRGSATETDRANVFNWLEKQPAIKGISVGPLVDAWWGW